MPPSPPPCAAHRRKCVAFVAHQYGPRLDWSTVSLADLDEVCTVPSPAAPIVGMARRAAGLGRA
jgi:hypothetical protein